MRVGRGTNDLFDVKWPKFSLSKICRRCRFPKDKRKISIKYKIFMFYHQVNLNRISIEMNELVVFFQIN